MRTLFIFMSAICLTIVFSSCNGIFEEDRATMCWSSDGQFVSVRCSTSGCDSDESIYGSYEEYSDWGTCWDATDAALDDLTGNGGDNGGSTPSYCNNGYSGPTSDPQVDSFCEAAYTAICVGGYSTSSTEVQTYCEYFDAFDVSYSCPYCN